MTFKKRAQALTFDRDLQQEIIALLRTVELEAYERAAKAFREHRLVYHHQRVLNGEIPAAQAAMFADDDAAQFAKAIREQGRR